MNSEKVLDVAFHCGEKHFYYKIVCIFFGTSTQQFEPKKISVWKTQKPKRFLGFFVSFFTVGFKRYHFPKTTFGEDLNYLP